MQNCPVSQIRGFSVPVLWALAKQRRPDLGSLGNSQTETVDHRRPRQRRSWSFWLAISGLCSTHQTLEVELLTVTVTFFTAWCYNNTAAAHGLWSLKETRPRWSSSQARKFWPLREIMIRSSNAWEKFDDLYNFAHQSPNVHRFDAHFNSENASTSIFFSDFPTEAAGTPVYTLFFFL